MTDNKTATELIKKLVFDLRRLEYEADKPGSDMTLGEYERKEAELIGECVQAIAATLGDDDYERKMDALLCRLTNGKWSKSRTYSLDFMESCIREEFERDYDEQICSIIGSGECEMEQIGNVLDIRKCSACGYSIVCEMLNVLRYCLHCGKAVKS